MTEFPIITLRIPNPFSEGRNRVYVIPSDPLTLIDAGTATDKSFDTLVRELDKHGLSIRDIGRVFLTHKHIDHIGNAWRIQQQSGAEILIHESEMESIRNVDPESHEFRALVRQRLDEWKVPEEELPNQDNLVGPTWAIEPAIPTGVVDGQRIDIGCGDIQVLHTPGHTAGSICLKFGRQLFSGDHVLPDISPNVGGGDMRRRGLLQQFLGSLQRTQDIAPDFETVWPGHGEAFEHLAWRCHELTNHHRQRLDYAIEFLDQKGTLSAYGMARCLFGEMRDFHIVLGCAEAQAHLEFLLDEGRICCHDGMYSRV